MTWLVDIGNSSIKWAQFTDHEIGESHAFVHAGSALADVLDSHWGALASPGNLLCCCVAGAQFTEAFTHWCEQNWGITPALIHAQAQANGVNNAYSQAERLGADRWAALVAAHALFDGPVCIIDCGSAITVDVIQSDGEHLGGLILPGLRLMRESLKTGTHIEVEESEGGNTTLFARNTADAINGGALYAVVATLDRIYNDVEQALEKPTKRVICGGDAADLLPLLASETLYVPDLVLQGLAMIYQSMQEEDK